VRRHRKRAAVGGRYVQRHDNCSNGTSVGRPHRGPKKAGQASSGVALESLRGSGPHWAALFQAEGRGAGQPAKKMSVPRVIRERQQFLRTCHAAWQATGASAAGQRARTSWARPSAAPGETWPSNLQGQAVIRNMAASLTAPAFHVGYTIHHRSLRLPSYKQVERPRGVHD